MWSLALDRQLLGGRGRERESWQTRYMTMRTAAGTYATKKNPPPNYSLSSHYPSVHLVCPLLLRPSPPRFLLGRFIACWGDLGLSRLDVVRCPLRPSCRFAGLVRRLGHYWLQNTPARPSGRRIHPSSPQTSSSFVARLPASSTQTSIRQPAIACRHRRLRRPRPTPSLADNTSCAIANFPCPCLILPVPEASLGANADPGHVTWASTVEPSRIFWCFLRV